VIAIVLAVILVSLIGMLKKGKHDQKKKKSNNDGVVVVPSSVGTGGKVSKTHVMVVNLFRLF
jgi:uncharacterized alpha/beta hydrolase family protein